MPVPDVVHELIERFALHGDEYRTGRFNETQLRRDFLDPFFEALGWDVSNKNNYAEAYRDVIHEDAIKIGGATKAPDYCFRIGGTRKFFVEAKKPGVNLKTDALPAYQLRRYGWSAKLPLCILTDFEEFAVYDCRRKPEPSDKASTARTMYIKCADFVEEWEKIAGVFSREAVLKGSFDKYADSTKKKRGTAEVDDAFLAEIETWREKLARNIALRNDLGVRELNHAVQKTIDRLIFLRICEDRGIEDYGRLQALQNGPKVYERLTQLFEAADDRYNSGLFHFHTEKNRIEPPDEWTLTLAIDDKPLKEILRHLYYPDSPYEFSVLPADILGQVYERFLGRVIRLTPGGSAKVEEKPEVRKAGGVYYTPTYIVDYIVENTVGKLLEGAEVKQAERRNRRLDRTLRVLDPACGSGSFLLGAYQYLLDWYLNWYLDHDPEKLAATASPPIYRGVQSAWRLTAVERKRILLDHIYGVDIDPQAVEVTKLSLLLKVLEGETRETVQRQLFAKERALPDLAENIKCGNSLIGSDFYRDKQLALFDEEEQLRINAFDWEVEFKEIMAGGGFDAVIGNPPYIRIQTLKESAPATVGYYGKTYRAAAKGNYDIYVIFVEKGLAVLNANGQLGVILPHKFFNAKYGESLRGVISDGGHLQKIVHFGDEQVFSGATTYTCLLFLSKDASETFDFEQVDDLEAWQLREEGGEAEASQAFEKDALPAEDATAGEWNFIIGPGSQLHKRLVNDTYTLKDISDRIFQGFKTGADTVFILSKNEDDSFYSKCLDEQVQLDNHYLRTLYKSGNFQRYSISRTERVIIFPYRQGALERWSEIERNAPMTAEYLRQCKGTLENREKGRWAGQEWYCYSRRQALELMEQPKILTADLNSSAKYCLDKAGAVFFTGGAAGGYGVLISGIDTLYVLGLLNSKLLDWFLQNISSTFRGGWYSYESKYISQLPIRLIDRNNTTDRAQHDEMVSLVRQMLDLNEGLATAKTNLQKTHFQRRIAATDTRIDRLVYELYGLSDEEIAIVEEAAG